MALWNSRPLNGAGSDPFGRKTDNKGKERLSAESVKCPSCGSNIYYQPELQAMMCRNCGNIYSPDTLEPRGSLGVSKERDYLGDSDISEDDKKRHEIVCNSCGAEVIADENTISTLCPFCGSPALITRRMTREFKPDYIVPFKIDKAGAERRLNEWLSSRKYTPAGFRSKRRMKNLTSIYVPFWLLDCVVQSDMSGTGKIINGTVKKIYEVNSTIKYYVKGVPFDASLKIANKLMQAIEPFDYSEMVRFESKYLQGFYAEKYDQRPTEMTDRIMRRLDKFSKNETDLVARKYDEYEVRPEKDFTIINDVSIKYCLLPVWLMTIEYEGRQFQLAVNGQTGEAGGFVPTTSAADKLSRIARFTSGRWIKIPVFLMLLFAVSLFMLTLSLEIGPGKTILIKALTAGEISIIVLLIALLVTHIVTKCLSKKIRDTSDELNDYDEDPGLDSYFDSTRHSDLKISEIPLRYVTLMTDSEGRVIGEHSIEI